jgi:hypothetical protein
MSSIFLNFHLFSKIPKYQAYSNQQIGRKKQLLAYASCNFQGSNQKIAHGFSPADRTSRYRQHCLSGLK